MEKTVNTVAVCKYKINLANQLLNEVLAALREDGNLSREKNMSLTTDVITAIANLSKAVDPDW